MAERLIQQRQRRRDIVVTAVARPFAQRGDLFATLVQRQLWLRRKRSRLGLLWPIVSPFLLMLLYVFVFKRVFHVPVDRYPDYLLCGLLPWSFLAVTVVKASSSLSTEPEILRKAPLPYEVLPISSVASQVIDFVVTLALFIAWLTATGNLHAAVLPALIFPVAAVVLLVMSIAMLVALIDVYNHDLRQVLGNLLTVWFFLVPIVYQPRMAPGPVQSLRSIDPMNMVVGQMRDVLYFGRISRPGHVVLMLAVCVALLGASLVAFRRFAINVPKDV